MLSFLPKEKDGNPTDFTGQGKTAHFKETKISKLKS